MSYCSVNLSLQKCGSLPSWKKLESRWTLLSAVLTRGSRSGLLNQSTTVQPSALAFSDSGTKVFCAFQTGAVYVLDFIHCKYSLLATLGQTVTALTIHPLHGRIYVGLNDGTVHVLEQATGAEVEILKGHNSQIQKINVQPGSGKYVLTSSSNGAILWKVETREGKRRLNIQTGSTLASALFVPSTGQEIITCFRDGSLYVWNTETLECLCGETSLAYPATGYRTFAFNETGQYMFAGGRSAFIDIWFLSRPAILGSIITNKDSDRSLRCSAPRVFERVQMPNSSTMIRKLSWIPRGFLLVKNKPFKSNDPDDNEQLSGYLIVLGNDHRVRCLVRTRRQNLLSKNSLSSQAAGDGGSQNCVIWKCLFTLGMGTCEDPFISNFESPNLSQFGSRDWPSWYSVYLQENFPLVLIDVQGYIHVISLTAAIEHFKKPMPYTVTVEDDVCKGHVSSCCTQNHNSSKKNCKVFARHDPVSNPARRLTTDKRTMNSITSGENFKDPTGGLLERRKLRLLLNEFGHFPEKYRLFIWRTVLQLPNNTQAFSVLLSKGINPAHELLSMHYPVRDQKLLRVFQKVCSCLAFWSPLFGETDWLPLFIFPFVKLFQSNMMHAFEVVATVLMNWCFTWFEYFPNPPINVLCMVENLLAYTDPDLYKHFVRYDVTTEIYAWPLLQTAFSEVFTQNEWLILWDNLLCHPPGVLLATVVAYAVCARGSLLLVRDIEKFETFFHGQGSSSVLLVVHRAHQILASTPPQLQPDRLLATLTYVDGNIDKIDAYPVRSSACFYPLTTPQYPIVTRYPKFIVDFHIRERERIREEEKEYLRQRATLEDMRRRTEILANEEENWYRQQGLLLDAEERRRTMLAQEEARLSEQRKRLNALLREVKLHELTLAEKSNWSSHQLEIRRRKVELDKLEEQLKRLANRRANEMDGAAHSMKLARLEEALQMKRAEAMTAVMRAQTDLMKQSDDGVLNSVSPVPLASRGDLLSRTGQADSKHLTNEFLNGLHSNIATANWVASNHAAGTKDPTASTRIRPFEEFTNYTLDQFPFSSTKLPSNEKAGETAEIVDISTTVLSPNRKKCGLASDDSSDYESEKIPSSPAIHGSSLSIRELRREDQILIDQVEILSHHLKREKV